MPSIKTYNPATGDELKSYNIVSEAEITEALTLAAAAQQQWRSRSFAERATVLRRIATQLLQQRDRLATLCTTEMGKPIAQSRAEVEKCALCLNHYADNGAQYLADEPVTTDASKSYVSYQPLGVVLAVMPWNFPYWQVFRAMAPILMGGNTMLLKHASNVSGCSQAIQQMVEDSGAPAGLFQSLILPGKEVEALIARPQIKAVTFTGSTAAGAKVAAAAASHIKKQVLELGGSDAYVILKDADLEEAAEVLVNGRMVNSGQSCVAAKRFVVVKEVKEKFEALVKTRIEKMQYGDPLNEDSDIGPMSREDLRNELHQQVQVSLAKGAKLLCGGTIPQQPGAWYPPTLLTDVVPGMPAYEEELFGPVATILEAKDEEDALRIANDTLYGLGGGIFSADVQHAEELAKQHLDAGSCFVNAFVHSDPRLPFGGTKMSGYGRELGPFGIREFTNVKTIFIK